MLKLIKTGDVSWKFFSVSSMQYDISESYIWPTMIKDNITSWLDVFVCQF